jgi:hypothetical protein
MAFAQLKLRRRNMEWQHSWWHLMMKAYALLQDCARRRVYLLSSALCASFARFIMDRRPFVAQRSYYVNKGRKKEILVSRGLK